MIIIVCADNNNGMMFNNRRQSQDRTLRDHILQLIGTSKLWMNEYSKKQFSIVNSAQIYVDNDYLEMAELGDYCFIETDTLLSYTDKIEKVVLFRWNCDL